MIYLQKEIEAIHTVHGMSGVAVNRIQLLCEKYAIEVLSSKLPTEYINDTNDEKLEQFEKLIISIINLSGDWVPHLNSDNVTDATNAKENIRRSANLLKEHAKLILSGKSNL